MLAITALFLVIFVWVAWSYRRRRDPLLRDVMVIFASVGMLFLLGLIRLAVEPPPRPVQAVFLALLLAQPLLTLRLVTRLRPVPRWIVAGAWTWWLAATVVVVAVPPPLPRPVVGPVVTLFFAIEAVAAGLLVGQARRRGGAARVRLRCAAAGTVLFGVALLVAGAGVGGAGRPVAVVSAVMYVLAFMPPRWLRRSWARGAAYELMRRVLTASTEEAPDQTWRRYCRAVGEVLGTDQVAVVLADTETTVRALTTSGSPIEQRSYPRADLDRLLEATVTVDVLAGPAAAATVAVAVDLASAAGARFVTAAPLPVAGRHGALVLFNRYRTLFADDDVALVADLAGHTAVLAERASVVAERQRLAVIVESSHDAIIGKTLHGVITSWNSGAQDLYGYTAAEVIGRHAGMLFPPGQEEVEAQLMSRIVAGERIDQHEVQRRRRDGTVITVALTLSPITDPTGQVVGVASISRDISERRRAETMFRGLLEAAPDAIIGVTRDGTITLINAQAERLFGYDRHELLGRCVDILVPERLRAQHPRLRERYFSHPRTRPMGAGTALSAVRKDGSEFPAEISLSALETDQGIIVSAAIRDVTERVHAQADRERLIAQAERDAAERRLQHARRLESLGQLAGGVAHDFNNILAVIANYTELLIDTLTVVPTADDLAAARADLEQISRATERAARLTKQLLAFGRREIAQAEVLNINDIIGEVEQMLRRTLGEHIHLVTRLDPDLSPIHADPGQLEQILLNLAVNARDAMPTGGTLSIDTTNAHLDADDVAGRPLVPGHYVRLRISDTGTGMPPGVAERAFEPFYTTKPAGAGTGLGLATVYGIATGAGGDVHLYSEPDIGTTVTILLPASSDTNIRTTTAPADASASHLTATAAHHTILIVEDEPALREVTSRILARAGYQVLTATDGAHAIQLARTHPEPIHLLLTDVIMPDMMGNEVAARIQAQRPDIPVLYMSGYAQPVLTENGTLLPGVTIVEKPFTRHELLQRIHHVLTHATDAAPALAGPANPQYQPTRSS